MSNNNIESIQTTKFHGHQGSVLCLDVTQDESYLLSGSEDKTARLWDLRADKRRACVCIQASGEVLSLAFAPPPPTPIPSPPSPISINQESPFSKDMTVFLSVDKFIYEYDLRKANAPILRQPTRDLSPILQNQDEVNQLSLAYCTDHYQQHYPSKSSKRKGSKNSTKKSTIAQQQQQQQQQRTGNSLFLAAADDSGTVRFMDTTLESSQILHHDANGVAVVPSCAFRPGSNKSLELASGGTDCKIHLWDVLKPRRPVSSYTITPLDDTSTSPENKKPQVCNPPMVHTLCWSPSGRLLAAGLGDGNCSVFSLENRSLVQVGHLTPGHDASVASVLFPAFAKGSERILLSAGTDGAILCWDLGSNMFLDDNDSEDDSEARHVAQLSQLFNSTVLDNNNRVADTTNVVQHSLKPRVLFGIPHDSKPNWMTSRKDPSTIYVADTSNDITAYVIPQR